MTMMKFIISSGNKLTVMTEKSISQSGFVHNAFFSDNTNRAEIKITDCYVSYWIFFQIHSGNN